MSATNFSKTFDVAREIAASSTLPPSSWYIITATTLLTADGAEHYGPLYTHTVKQLSSAPDAVSPDRLSTSFREIIIKSWTLVGMPRAIAGYYSLRNATDLAPEDWTSTLSRRESALSNPQGALATAETWFESAFAEEQDRIWGGFKDQKDMEWTLKYIVYGLYIADLSVLSPVENELVVLACVMGQGSKSPTRTHLSALKRLGVSEGDADAVVRIVKEVCQALGKDTSGWVV